MASTLRKLGLIVWKNLLLKKRHWILTSLEIILPVLLYAVLAYLKSLAAIPGVTTEYVDHNTTFPVETKNDLHGVYGFFMYAPTNNFTKKIMEKFSNNTGLNMDKIEGAETESDIASASYAYDIGNASKDLRAGFLFESADLPDGSPPESFSYKIRIKTFINVDNLYPPYLPENGPISYDIYIFREFLRYQLEIDKAFMDLVSDHLGRSNTDGSMKWEFQKLPYPPYESSSGGSLYNIYAMMTTMFTVVGFLFVFPNMLKRMVEEKETGIKELMKMMGLPAWVNWFGWFTYSLSLLLISITIMTVLVKVEFGPGLAVFENTDGTIIWFFLFVYSISCIMFTFALSSFFSRPAIATVLGVMIWLMTYTIPVNTVKLEETSLSAELALALLPNTALSWGFEIISEYEKRNAGVTWSNLGEPPNNREELSLGLLFLMLVVDSIIYLIIALYVEAVLPGKYGTAKPWYFLFMPEYWRDNKNNIIDDMEMNGGPAENKGEFESDPAGLTAGIEIHNLRKVFKSILGEEKLAVDGVTLNIFSGQITALLGHNGAGKTTTMSMLTGLYSPSSGSAKVNGYDIKFHLDKARESLGLCPQFNMLFPELTTEEHLIFFGMLKGHSRKEAKLEAQHMLQNLLLSDKSDVLSTKLSGGMKRKLSLAIALVGNPQVVMLDEPTSGLDPEGRRLVWDLLQSLRGNKTILLTTHFMEEADVLGDRIAIMAHGKIYCCGSPIFLKKLYGAGYLLTMTKDHNCNVQAVTSTVQEFVNDATLKSNIGNEISYSLPTNKTKDFPELFEALERRKKDIDIQSFGVSITTMEQVFLKVGELADKEEGVERDEDIHNNHLNGENHHKLESSQEALKSTHVTGLHLGLQRFRALFIKKMLYLARKWFFFLCMIILCISMVIICIIVLNIVQEADSGTDSQRVINLKDYGKTHTLVNYTDEPNVVGIGEKYKNLPVFTGHTTIDTTDSIEHDVIQVGTANEQQYREQYIAAATFREEKNYIISRAMYNSVPSYASSISLNLIDNAILRYISQSDNYSITVTNHPLPDSSRYEFMINSNGVGAAGAFLFGVFLPIGLSFLAASFLIFPNKERVCGAKQLQLMFGVNPLLFWMTSLLCDFLVYFVAICLLTMCIGILDTTGTFGNYDTLGTVFLVLLLFGWSGIPMSYVFSFFTKTSAGAFALAVIVNMITGMVLSMTTMFLEIMQEHDIADGIKWSFRFIPTFTVSYAFINLINTASVNVKCEVLPEKALDMLCSMPTAIHKPYVECCEDLCEPLGVCFKPTPLTGWKYPAVGQDILFLALDGFLYLLILFLIESGIIKTLIHLILASVSGDEGQTLARELDSDVAKEKQRVAQLIRTKQSSDDVLMVQDLSRRFRTITAVDNVSFGVHYGECFGLLGINGAGKTTTFRMLTGDEILSSGNVYLLTKSLSKNRTKFLENIGYCPQFDGLIDELTGREILSLFARLRGIPFANVSDEVEKLFNLLGLDEYADRRTGTYSGGNKRKLSTAMALIGDPPIIFLDEPTSGVDPVARRKLWDVLSMVQKSGQSVILTSHSMEECEALCSRLCIMVNGQFQCLGGTQYLKSKFGQGFTVLLTLRHDPTGHQISDLKTNIAQKFNRCVLKDEHQGLLHYHIGDPQTPWTYLFRTMEEFKDQLDVIEDYSISETTLEQVFLSFARVQREDSRLRKRRKRCGCC